MAPNAAPNAAGKAAFRAGRITGNSDRSLWHSTNRDRPMFKRLAYQSPSIPDEAGAVSTIGSLNRLTTRCMQRKTSIKTDGQELPGPEEIRVSEYNFRGAGSPKRAARGFPLSPASPPSGQYPPGRRHSPQVATAAAQRSCQ